MGRYGEGFWGGERKDLARLGLYEEKSILKSNGREAREEKKGDEEREREKLQAVIRYHLSCSV
jgi:hypothetical protein